MDSHLLKTKSIEQLVGDVEHGKKHLKRTLSALDLTLLGIGAIIGTGIFVLTGTAAANQAGPSITMSYMVAGLACGFAALCYAEFASMIPIAGSAYTYAYATLGEVVAWMIGWGTGPASTCRSGCPRPLVPRLARSSTFRPS